MLLSLAGKASQICPRLALQWKKVPGLTRPDDVERNARLEEFRAEKERKKAGAEDAEAPPWHGCARTAC